MTEGWEYRWGDLPFNADGTPDWAPTLQPEQWHAIGFPSNPPDRNGQDQVWFRVTLPAGDFKEPVLYISSVDLITQVWLDGKNIYQDGTFDESGRGKFEGWSWHEIPLPADYENKALYFRVYSGYTDIGLWGEVRLMDHSELMPYILKNSLEDLLVAGFSLLVAKFALIFSMIQGGRKCFPSIALFAMASSVMLVAESPASLLVFHNALFWNYLAAGGYYLLPVALGLMLDQWLGDRRTPAISLIWKLHLGYVVGALGLALTGVVELSSTYPPFDVLLLFSLSVMAVLTIPRLRSFSGEQQVLVLACSVFGVLLIADMAVAHGLLPWAQVPTSLGLLVFSLAVAIISVRHYASTQHALQKLTVTLEQQVAERTEKAEALLQLEQTRADFLALENEKSRMFVDIIGKLQPCVSLNQAFHLLVEALPALCNPINGMMYRRVPGGHYERIVSWGYGGKHPEAIPAVVSPHDFPERAHLVAGSLEDDEAAFRNLRGLVSIPINVQFASHGSAPEGMLLLDGAGIRRSGSARLLSSFNLAVERIGVTLSGISLREELQRFSYEDALTGLKNRRYFDQLYEHEMTVALRKRSALSLLLLDIDHFKRFNDTHGHEAGDAALQAFASVLESRFRGSDVVCRHGGEEFVVILPGSDIASARALAEQLCEAVRQEPVVFEDNNLGPLTTTVGVAAWPDSTDEPGELFKLADEALYRAKSSGRDRVEVF
ncbi:MAG: diguanylate cyclase [Marinobacter sp.]